MYRILLVVFVSTFYLYAKPDWPVWRGIHGDGISRETGIMKRWKKKGPKIVWRTSLGGGFSGISASKEILYTLFCDSKYEYATALKAKTGKIIWKKRIGKVYTRAHGNGPRSTPTVVSGKVYVVSASGDMWCLKALSGKKFGRSIS